MPSLHHDTHDTHITLDIPLRRVLRHRLATLTGLVGVLAFMVTGCQSGEPVEVSVNSAFDLTSTPVTATPPAPPENLAAVEWHLSTGWVIESATAVRDGERTRARLEAMAGDVALSLDMELEVDPQVTLRSGRWLCRGAQGPKALGTIRASNLRFLGGQAGWPSIGGVFVLEGPNRFPYVRIRIDSLELPPSPQPRTP